MNAITIEQAGSPGSLIKQVRERESANTWKAKVVPDSTCLDTLLAGIFVGIWNTDHTLTHTHTHTHTQRIPLAITFYITFPLSLELKNMTIAFDDTCAHYVAR